MTTTKLLLMAPIRAILVLIALAAIVGPMLFVANIWGLDASVRETTSSRLLMVVIVVATVVAFLAGALVAYVSRIGADIRFHAAIVISRRPDSSASDQKSAVPQEPQ